MTFTNTYILVFSGGSAGKEFVFNAGDLRSIPGLGMATHSSIPAWRIPWIIQSMALQRAGHD